MTLVPNSPRTSKRFQVCLGALLLTLLLPSISFATNGLNLIGSGGISSALAGADTAVALDFSTMHSNPAGISFLPPRTYGMSIAVLKPQLSFKNSTNDRNGENEPLLLPNLAVSYRLGSTPITVGLGFFTIGGTSSEFENMNVQVFGNPPIFGGTVDKERTQQRTYKMTPTIAYAVTKDFSLGVGLDVSYVDASLGILPNTPGAVGAPFGFETKGACDRTNGISFPNTGCPYDVNFSPKFGAMYRVNEIVTLGVRYTLQSQFTLDHGEFVKNYSPLTNPGVGKVNFDGKAFGFKTPQDVAAGIAVRPTKRLLLSAKFQWINWNQALKSITVELTHPSNPAIASDSFVLNYNWRDQYVVAVGALYDVTDRLSVSGGFNYGNNPIPTSTVDPINANIIKNHIIGGAVYHFTPKFMLGSWFTYAFKNSMTYDSALFGPAATLEVKGYDVGLFLNYSN